MIENDKLILVGVIVAAKGIKGEATIKSFTEQKINIADLNLTTDQGIKMQLRIVRKNSKDELICQVNNYRTRNEIENIKGVKLFCRRADFPKLEADEFYIIDLKGRAVVDKSHQRIGIVHDMVNFGAGDLIEIEFNNSQKELFIFNAKNFPEIKDEYLMFVPPTIAN